jgi:hypothetical protein
LSGAKAVTNSCAGDISLLDKAESRFKIPGNSAANKARVPREFCGFMTPKSPPASQAVEPKQPCKHPRVQIVSRDEDAEFVECEECGEIFESSEFKDMNIEESTKEREP